MTDVLNNGLTEKQRELFSKLTRLQQEFLKFYLVGENKERNATQAIYKAKESLDQKAPKTPQAAAVSGSNILNNPKVQKFIAAIEESVIEKVEKTLIMSRQEMAERLTAMARSNIHDVVEFEDIELEDANENIVKQTISRMKYAPESTIGIAGITMTKSGLLLPQMHDQKAAMKQLSDVMGYNREVEGDDAKLTQEELLLQMIEGDAVTEDKLYD